jgi:hypothetical protein
MQGTRTMFSTMQEMPEKVDDNRTVGSKKRKEF